MNAQLPHGAEALLISLQTPNPKGGIGIPVLLWGKPGEGKSSFIEHLAKSDFPVQTLIASIHDPTDFSGLPFLQEGQVRYAVPEWALQFGKGQGILFLDELTTAPPAVQAALLRVVLERKVGFHSLPPEVRVVAAANPAEFMAGGWELSPPLCNRFVHIEWASYVEGFLRGINEGFRRPVLPDVPAGAHGHAAAQWKAIVTAFLRTAPHLLTTKPADDHLAFATPRTWEYAIALLASCEVLGSGPTPGLRSTGVFFSLLLGCIGKAAALPFVEFVQGLRIPNPIDLLEGRTNVDPHALNDSEWFMLYAVLVNNLIKNIDTKQLVPQGERFLALTMKMFEAGKRDVAFVALRRLLAAGFSTKMLEKAHLFGRPTVEKITSHLNAFKEDEGLSAYLQIVKK